MLISANPLLLEPLSTTLGLEDMHDLLEVMQVDAHNKRVYRKWLKAQER